MKKVNSMKNAPVVERTLTKLETAWSQKFADQTFANFCETVCKGRFAGRCENCPINLAYEKARQEIQDGKRSRPESQYCSVNYGAFRYYDGKGHKTEVWRAPDTK